MPHLSNRRTVAPINGSFPSTHGSSNRYGPTVIVGCEEGQPDVLGSCVKGVIGTGGRNTDGAIEGTKGIEGLEEG